ncbi:uncharacterized protein FOMMEDRAFT_146910 [Fomitiporia mediterranea MF3/22]|uniref:uncharacterized protein n=1 Tax=Fomitiporia mediterranea (strain MF3/22) TaxID=694068 RepID=UPI0004409400|nr:uncharacterized protein FOMMEDRAFT_146910 [Fomitiporia mediterranea MF3/22]EJD03304.1 hypothetical protein FOMMEDRAFT_146910 [Fomitiporia mediterranea MF3/22]
MPPPKKADPPHKMVFTANSLRNTTIAVDDDTLYYEIVTRFWHPTITKIKKLDIDSQQMITVAEIEREPKREPRVRFGLDKDENAAWTDAREWLHYTPKKTRGGVFNSNSGVSYRWKTHNRQLQLIRADGDNKEPLVIKHKHKRHFFVMRMSKHAWLEIKPEVVESLEQLIVSYILVERRRRDSHPRVELKLSAD